MLDTFCFAFIQMAKVLSAIAGVGCAFLIAAFILGFCAAAFDSCTRLIALRWHKRQKIPKSRLGRIIYDHHNDYV